MMTPQELSMALFGVKDYKYNITVEVSWMVFSKDPFRAVPQFDEPKEPKLVKFHHGTTLNQVRCILERGFIVSKLGSKKHPAGVYGTDHPSHSYDRCNVLRSWSWAHMTGGRSFAGGMRPSHIAGACPAAS